MDSDKLYYQDLMDFRDSATKGLKARESKLEINKQTLNTLSTSEKFKGQTADSIKAYIKEVHLGLVNDLLEVKSMMQEKFNVYVAGYPSPVDKGGVNFKLDTKDYKALTKNITTDYEKIETIKSKVESIEDSVADLVSVDPSSYPGLAMNLLTDAQTYITEQSNAWTSYESSFQGNLDDVEDALNQSKQMIAQFSGGMAPSLGNYPAGLFNTLAGADGYALAYATLYTEAKNPDFKTEVKESKAALKTEKATLTGQQNGRVAKFVVDATFFVISAGITIASAGAGTPLILAAMPLVPAASELYEEGDEMASKGESDINPIRDYIFNKNQALYTVGSVAISGLGSKTAYKELVEDGAVVATSKDGKSILKATVEDLAKNGMNSAANTAVERIQASAIPQLVDGLNVTSAQQIVTVYTKEAAKQAAKEGVKQLSKPVISQNVAVPIASRFGAKDSLKYEVIKDTITTGVSRGISKTTMNGINSFGDNSGTGGYASPYNNSWSLLGGQ